MSHASLGPSSSSRWMNCAGSPRLIAEVPAAVRDRSSPAAQEGTFAHSLGEGALTNGVSVKEFVRTHTLRDSITREMIENVQVYVDQCNYLADEASVILVESHLGLEALDPPAPMYGTGDFLCYVDHARHLDVCDLKYGKGVVVEVKGNTQLKYYGLGGVLKMQEKGLPVETVCVYIVQPRVDHPDGVIRSVEYTITEMAEFSIELLAAARATLDPNAPLTVGPWCRWCPASAICPERASDSLAVAKAEFDVGVEPVSQPPRPETLSPDELAWVLQRLPQLEEWASSVRKFAHDSLEQGYDVPGQKLVAKRATRKWNDADDAAQYYLTAGFDPYEERKTISPAQMEKLLKGESKELREALDGMVNKKSSGTTMVPESDKRPGIKADAFPVRPKGENE